MENRDLIILIILVILIGGGLTWQEGNYSKETSLVSIKTDKTDYEEQGTLKLAIKNNSWKNICFSSCYPYVLEKKNNGWLSYPYQSCSKPDVNQICLSAFQSKFFEIILPFLDKGTHRLAVPACLNCDNKDGFREDNKFYSNEFSIK